MPISTASAKAKGRKLQQWVRDTILKLWPSLETDDVRSTAMGSNGVDIQLSPVAHRLFPYSVECKSRASIGIYSFYDQASANSGKYEPLLIIKADREKPLAVVSADHFFELVKNCNGSVK